MKISLVMIAKNEAKVIGRCLNSIKNSVDEMIVVDTGSTDNTKNIASEFGAKVFDFTWVNDFSSARNFGLSNARGDWILVLDADEYVKEDYRDVLLSFAEKREKIGKIQIVSSFNQNGYVQESSTFVSRFFPKGVSFTGKIHEQLDSYFKRENIEMCIYHDGYLDKDKSGRNIPLLEAELEERPNDSYYLYQLAKEYRGINNYSLSIQYFENSLKHLLSNDSFSVSVKLDYFNTLILAGEFPKVFSFIDKNESFLVHLSDYHFSKGNFYMNYLSTLSNPTIEEIQQIEKSYLQCLEIGETTDMDGLKGTGSYLASYNLALLYELFGLKDKAVHYYKLSSEDGFEPAAIRLNSLSFN